MNLFWTFVGVTVAALVVVWFGIRWWYGEKDRHLKRCLGIEEEKERR